MNNVEVRDKGFGNRTALVRALGHSSINVTMEFYQGSLAKISALPGSTRELAKRKKTRSPGSKGLF
jgi:hypothetical protein